MQLSHAHSIRSYPAVGEPFEMVFYGDYGANQPLELVRQAGYAPSGWAHNGSLVTGRAIRSFKLIKVSANRLFDDVLSQLSLHGKIPEGQWIRGFKTAYPKPDCKKYVAVADATWVGPDGRTYFPYISRAGDLRFHRSNGSFDGDYWLWIVAVSG